MIFNSYYNAKLLLTAEYLVLNGAKALAVPLRFGQRLSVEGNRSGFILWKSMAHDGSVWFEGKYSVADFKIIECNNPEIAIYPQKLLQAAKKLNPDFCSATNGFQVIATLNYPLQWGLGSSSTLIAAIAGWAKVNPFELHFEVSKGSGYDIACAISPGPLLYQLSGQQANFESVVFNPLFADKIFFVYEGKKQDSAESIQKYKSRASNVDTKSIETASLLTQRMLNSVTLSEFEEVIREHEQLISDLIGVKPIKDLIFNDLPGEAKSLGAWGGDFCMLTWHDDPQLLPAYLKSKNLETWFNFSEIVL